MGETLTERPKKTKEEVATQVARIADKLIKRADASGMAMDNYPSGKSFSFTETSPETGKPVVTSVENDDKGMAKIQSYSLDKGERVGGQSVTAVPEIGMDAATIGSEGHHYTANGVSRDKALGNVPNQLSDIRGKIAEREISGDNPKARLAA